MSYYRCKNIHKSGNKYSPSAYKKKVKFRSHFRERVSLMVRDIQYLPTAYKTQVEFRSHFFGKKSASYGPRNTVFIFQLYLHSTCKFHVTTPHNINKSCIWTLDKEVH